MTTEKELFLIDAARQRYELERTKIIEKKMETFNQLHTKALQENKLPLCTDCEYIAKSPYGETEKHQCLAPFNFKGISIVDGSPLKVYDTCKQQRGTLEQDCCTVHAIWFKQKEYLPPLITASLAQVHKLKSVITKDKLDNL